MKQSTVNSESSSSSSAEDLTESFNSVSIHRSNSMDVQNLAITRLYRTILQTYTDPLTYSTFERNILQIKKLLGWLKNQVTADTQTTEIFKELFKKFDGPETPDNRFKESFIVSKNMTKDLIADDEQVTIQKKIVLLGNLHTSMLGMCRKHITKSEMLTSISQISDFIEKVSFIRIKLKTLPLLCAVHFFENNENVDLDIVNLVKEGITRKLTEQEHKLIPERLSPTELYKAITEFKDQYSIKSSSRDIFEYLILNFNPKMAQAFRKLISDKLKQQKQSENPNNEEVSKKRKIEEIIPSSQAQYSDSESEDESNSSKNTTFKRPKPN